MSKCLFSFEGRFKMWTYDVSHGRLLLRRQSSDVFSRRVDVLFVDVRVVRIASYFDSLVVSEEENGEMPNDFKGVKYLSEPGFKIFEVKCVEWIGYVVAGNVFWCEDDDKFSEPSRIFKPGPLMQSLAKNGYL